MDLGANGFQTFRYIVLPNIATALLTAYYLTRDTHDVGGSGK